ncbi:uncharacterized protein LOC144763652 [Lissotriton helveticus]
MTTKKVSKRIVDHRSNIRCKRATTKMTTHFIEKQHTPNDKKWVVLEHRKPTENLKQKLLEKEQRVTSGDGASAEVAVLGEDSEDSGEEAVQEPADGPVGVQTVVAETVAPSKSTTRREQARMARQRRLEATVAEYRRLVALEEEEDTQSSGATTTSSTGTAASSSVTKPAGPSRANKDNRHRQATEIPAAPHRSCKERQRRLRVRMSNLEQEVLKYKNLVKGLRSELATLRKEYDAHAAKCTSTSTLQ